MSADDILGAVALLNPGALARARRLTAAVALLQAGVSQADARVQIRIRFQCDRVEAWRLVAMAADLAAPLPATVTGAVAP